MTKIPKISAKILWQLLLAILILAVGAGLYLLLAYLRRPPARVERPPLAPFVEAVRVQQEDLQMTVTGFGTARARRSVSLVPQVSGRIIEVSPNFMEGGFFEAGEELITIDPSDYELAVQNAQAAVAQAEFNLQQEEAEAEVARREWEAMRPNAEPPAPLVLREPQIRNAQAQLEAARAQLARARLNLERTVISLPFNGRVVQKNVDVGQFVSPGETLANVYGTDAIEIIVPLEDYELEWFDAPLTYDGGRRLAGPQAEVIAQFAGRVHRWQGRIVRTQGRIDPASRMVNVIAEVSNPGLTDEEVPLTPGMFVRVEIEGRRLEDVIRVPRHAVHEDEYVWVVREDRLFIQKVETIRSDARYAYIVAGVQEGDVVITSPLDVVTDGMAVRVQLEGLSEAAEESTL